MIIANSTGYELAPAGTHNVVCKISAELRQIGRASCRERV